MSTKQNDIYNEAAEEAKQEKYPDMVLCKECKSMYHPKKYSMCFKCFAKPRK